MKKILIFVSAVFIIIFLFPACDGGNGTTDVDGDSDNGGDDTTPDNPTPVLTSISPASKVQHLPAFTLTATGTDFIEGAKITFDGAEKETTYVSSTELTCTIEPDDIMENTAAYVYNPIAVQDTDVNVYVNNPSPGGGDSGTKTFTIRSHHTFNPFVDLMDNGLPDIAVDSQGTIYVVYEKGIITETSILSDINIVTSSDGGETWSDPVNVSNTPGRSFYPAVAVESSENSTQQGETFRADTQDTVYVIWKDDSGRGGQKYEVNIRRSTDGGTTWSPREEISQSGGKIHNLSPLDITVGGDDTVYVVWSDVRNTHEGEIYFSKAAGESGLGIRALSWSTPKKIAEKQNPRIFVDGSHNLYLVCECYGSKQWDIEFTYSTDSGQTWKTPRNVSDIVDMQLEPDVAVDSQGIVHIIWKDLSSVNYSDIAYIHSTTAASFRAGMLSWTPPVFLTDTPKESKYPRLETDEADNLNVIWSDGSDCIYFIRSIDRGDTWTQKINIYNNYSNTNAMAVDKEGNINIAGDSMRVVFIGSKHWD